MLNHEYIKGSTIDIPSEIERLSILPNNFISNYRSLLEVRDISSLKELINNINKSIEEYVIPVELDEEVQCRILWYIYADNLEMIKIIDNCISNTSIVNINRI